MASPIKFTKENIATLIKGGIENFFKMGGINYYSVNEYGQSPLMYVLENNAELGFSKKDILKLLSRSALKDLDIEAQTPLMYLLKYNKDQNINLSRDEIIRVINHSNLDSPDINGDTALIYLLKYNYSQNLGFRSIDLEDYVNDYYEKNPNINLIDCLDIPAHTLMDIINNNDMSKLLPDGTSPLIKILELAVEKKIILSNINITDIVENSPATNIADNTGTTPGMYLINNNNQLSLANWQLLRIINKCDTNIKDNEGHTLLTRILTLNHTNGLDLSNKDILNIIKRSNFTHTTKDGYTPLDYILLNNHQQTLGFTYGDILKLIKENNWDHNSKDEQLLIAQLKNLLERNPDKLDTQIMIDVEEFNKNTIFEGVSRQVLDISGVNKQQAISLKKGEGIKSVVSRLKNAQENLKDSSMKIKNNG